MSRIAKVAIPIPQSVEVTLSDHVITMKGQHGTLLRHLHPMVKVHESEGKIFVEARSHSSLGRAQAGTAQRLISADLIGVSQTHKMVLMLSGVGYSAKLNVEKTHLMINLGFSHPIEYGLSEGISASCPSPTEIIVQGANKQQVGQVAANLRALRPPEPYKGKGVRYLTEKVRMKEAKKK